MYACVRAHMYIHCVRVHIHVFVCAYVFACMCDEGRLRALGPDHKGSEKTEGARTDAGGRESFLHQGRELLKEAFRKLPPAVGP